MSFPHEGGKARVSAPARYCAFVRENDVLTLTMPMDKARFYRAGKGKMDEYYEDESLRDWVREEVDTEMKKRFGDRWRDSGKSDGFIEARCKVLGNAKEEGGSAERLAHGFAEFVSIPLVSYLRHSAAAVPPSGLYSSTTEWLCAAIEVRLTNDH